MLPVERPVLVQAMLSDETLAVNRTVHLSEENAGFFSKIEGMLFKKMYTLGWWNHVTHHSDWEIIGFRLVLQRKVVK